MPCFEPFNNAVIVKHVVAKCQPYIIFVNKFFETYAATSHLERFFVLLYLTVFLNGNDDSHSLYGPLPIVLLYYNCVPNSSPHNTLASTYAEWIVLVIPVLIAYPACYQSHEKLNCQAD